ncbi:MAG: hypothetical protein AAGD00_08170 [Planctomycetota bacterium]
MPGLDLIIFLIVIGFSGASWVYGKIREQADLQRAREEARKRFEEQLRTGRAEVEEGEEQPTSREQRLDELAARRQAQLQELRKRQQAAARGGQQTVVLRGPSPQQVPSQQQSRQSQRQTNLPRPVARTPAMQAQRVRQPTRQQLIEQQQAAARQQMEAAQEEERRQRAARERLEAARRAEAERSVAPALRGHTVRELLLHPHDATRKNTLRALVGATEVLSPPMSARNERELPWNRPDAL